MNRKRLLRRVKAHQKEYREVVELAAQLMSTAGYTVSLPSELIPAIQDLLERVGPARPGHTRPLPAVRSSTPPIAHGPPPATAARGPAALPDPELEVGLTEAEIEARYKEKLQRTMALAEQAGRTPGGGLRVSGGRRVTRAVTPPEPDLPPLENEDDLDDLDPSDEYEDGELEETEEQGTEPSGPVNPKTGMSLEEQRALVEKLTKKPVPPPSPGKPNNLDR